MRVSQSSGFLAYRGSLLPCLEMMCILHPSRSAAKKQNKKKRREEKTITKQNKKKTLFAHGLQNLTDGNGGAGMGTQIRDAITFFSSVPISFPHGLCLSQ